MPDHKDLLNRMKALTQYLNRLSDRRQFIELIKIMKRPGWTTPAELIFASGIVDSMLAHTEALAKLKGDLLKGSRAVRSE